MSSVSVVKKSGEIFVEVKGCCFDLKDKTDRIDLLRLLSPNHVVLPGLDKIVVEEGNTYVLANSDLPIVTLGGEGMISSRKPFHVTDSIVIAPANLANGDLAMRVRA
ncbi:MAG: hypothetical protein WC069_01615 [Candidatus Shapirobacteria bacterium]